MNQVVGTLCLGVARRISVLLGLLVVCSFAELASAAIWYVDAARPDDAGAGTDWATAKKTIQAGVDVANDGDTVLVTNGVYDSGGNVQSQTRVYVWREILVESVNGPEVTVIKGQGPLGGSAMRCVSLAGASDMSGFTLTNGFTATSAMGGGIYCNGTNSVVSNCVITGNSSATYGGGSYGGTLLNCVFSGNSAITGGGGASAGNLTSCILRGNTAGSGGGSNASFMKDCMCVGNVAVNNGGGALGGRFDNCAFMDNTAGGNGGGGYFASLYNCLLSGNTAGLAGGGSYWGGVNSCTMVGNTANKGGGGVDHGSAYNSIVWGNSSGYYPEIYEAGAYFTCASSVSHGVDGCTTNNPLFVDAANSNYQLQATSPCFNGGNNDYSSALYDLVGNPRVVGDVVDMGAYERQTGPFPTPTPFATPEPNPTPTPNPCGTLGETLNTTGLVWTTGGNADWFPQFVVSQDGSCAAQSGEVDDHQTTWLETVVTNAGNLSFQWSVDSDYFDFLSFAVNGVVQTQISKNVSWQAVAYDLYSDVSYLRWEYAKDGFALSGANAGWVDQVVWTPFTGKYLHADASLAFGSVACSVTSTLPWVIRNPGMETLGLSGMTTNGAGASAFHFTGLPSSLAVGASVTCSVSFVPSSAQTYAASIEVAHNADNTTSPFVLQLSGSGYDSACHYVLAGNPNAAEPYTNWFSAAATIQAAVDTANDGDVVLVANGVYDTGGVVVPGGLLTNRVCITNAITVRSVNGPDVTTIKGAMGSNGSNDVDAVRGVFMTNGCSLVGFTITNGATWGVPASRFNDSGGGVWIATGCVVSNCTLSGNTARYYGGGSFGGQLDNCNLNGNVSYRGGGGSADGILNNCILRNNSTTGSGGGSCDDTLTHCVLTGNSAVRDGGGAENAIMSHCILSHNVAVEGEGGGIIFGFMNNCLLFGNTATTVGGGASLMEVVKNCTLSGNAAGDSGGGVYETATDNCIVWGNTAGSYKDIDNHDAYYFSRFTCSADVTDGDMGNTTNDPLFVDTANSNYQLQVSSPCINAGYNAFAPTDESPYDLAGTLRVVDWVVDMGAYEYPYAVVHIFASAGESGAIAPSGRVAVARGSSASFALLPDEYYEVSGVLTNGSSAGGSGTTNFIWSNIQTDGTLHVLFGALEAPMDTPLWWLAEYGMTQDMELAESADADGDGMLAWQEYVSGTNPTNAESVALAQTGVDQVQGNATSVVLTWLSATNATWRYDILETRDFVTFAPVATNLLPTPPVNVYTVTVEDAMGFYRIEANTP